MSARRRERDVTVFTVLADIDGDGEFGDGLKVFRFRDIADATRFAARSTTYGRLAHVKEDSVPLSIARRWGMA